MRVLLDTHLFLWVLAGSPLLGVGARRIIDAADHVYVSAASIWEVAIKTRLGKIDADPQALVELIDQSGFTELPVRAAHAAYVATLPMHHADPFDRLLIAQASIEPLKFLTADALLDRYGEVVTVVKR